MCLILFSDNRPASRRQERGARVVVEVRHPRQERRRLPGQSGVQGAEETREEGGKAEEMCSHVRPHVRPKSGFETLQARMGCLPCERLHS